MKKIFFHLFIIILLCLTLFFNEVFSASAPILLTTPLSPDFLTFKTVFLHKNNDFCKNNVFYNNKSQGFHHFISPSSRQVALNNLWMASYTMEQANLSTTLRLFGLLDFSLPNNNFGRFQPDGFSYG
jgi:hypothetical protein